MTRCSGCESDSGSGSAGGPTRTVVVAERLDAPVLTHQGPHDHLTVRTGLVGVRAPAPGPLLLAGSVYRWDWFWENKKCPAVACTGTASCRATGYGATKEEAIASASQAAVTLCGAKAQARATEDFCADDDHAASCACAGGTATATPGKGDQPGSTAVVTFKQPGDVPRKLNSGEHQGIQHFHATAPLKEHWVATGRFDVTYTGKCAK